MSSAAFWRLVDRLQLPDAEALELIAYAGKIGPSGKRPRFRLTTRQTRLASYLPEIEAALQAIGEAPGWVVRRPGGRDLDTGSAADNVAANRNAAANPFP
jgi:hypothetical protein